MAGSGIVTWQHSAIRCRATLTLLVHFSFFSLIFYVVFLTRNVPQIYIAHLSYERSVRPSVRPSVCHKLVPRGGNERIGSRGFRRRSAHDSSEILVSSTKFRVVVYRRLL